MIIAERRKANFHVYEFMKDMGLGGSALFVYALIYSFTLGERGLYYGTQRRLAVLLGVCEKTVQRCLKRLFDLGYVEKCSVTHDGICYTGVRALPRTGADKIANKNANTNASAAAVNNENAEASTASVRNETPAKRNGVSVVGAESITRSNLSVRGDGCVKYNMAMAALGGEENKKAGIPAALANGRPTEWGGFRTGVQPKYSLIYMGKDEIIGMTPAQREKLLELVSEELLNVYVRRLEVMISSPPFINDVYPHSHYRTLKKWINEDLSV